MESIDKEAMLYAVENGIPFFKGGSDGSITAANEEFCEILGYTEFELKRVGWKGLTLAGEDLLAEEATTNQMKDAGLLRFSLIKTFVSKSGNRVTGQLTALRWPASGQPMEYKLCWFVPLADNSKLVLEAVAKYTDRYKAVIEEQSRVLQASIDMVGNMTTIFSSQVSKPTSRKLFDAVGDWAMENPKKALVVFLILISLNPYPIIITWLTRAGYLPSQPVEIELRDDDNKSTPRGSADFSKPSLRDIVARRIE